MSKNDEGRDVKRPKRKCQLFPTKTLNMLIDSDVEGGVCACVREEVINGGSLSFPAHSSRWGGGVG